jgi:hypothetical protein
MHLMAKPPRAFVAFDYDNDSTLRDFLIGQSKHPDTNFEMHDWSVKQPFAQSNWKEKVRARIRASDLVKSSAVSTPIPQPALMLNSGLPKRKGNHISC